MDPIRFPHVSHPVALDALIAQAQNVVLQAVAESDPTGLPKALAEFGRGTDGLMVEPES